MQGDENFAGGRACRSYGTGSKTELWGRQGKYRSTGMP